MSRKFHPPYRNGFIVEAEWYDWNTTMVIRMANLKHRKYTKDGIVKRIIELLTHETLHGVIMGVQWKEKVPLEEKGDSEFPIEHGMDPVATQHANMICEKCSDSS
jgi:hypothetical protein